MKKILPTSTSLSVNKPSGFTLIELMVVVAIIAILAVIGFAIFQNAQKNARDGIRRGEINNLAKSIESSKDPTVANYTYTSATFAADYPTNKPKDPLKSATEPLYCVATSTTATPADPATWAATTTCPAGLNTLVDSTGAYNTSGATNALNTGIRYWKICTRLEVSGTIFCIGNSQ
jgi:prepilin-type N-terminal cleavage/methylation domain-containing protein